MEQAKHPRGQMFDRARWNIPVRLETAFQDANVELEVWLRKPKERRR